LGSEGKPELFYPTPRLSKNKSRWNIQRLFLIPLLNTPRSPAKRDFRFAPTSCGQCARYLGSGGEAAFHKIAQ
jgi:hypothetical protein